MRELTDLFGRKHDYLRISQTDKCNFNCIYCNPSHLPEERYSQLQILTYEEILRLIRLFAGELGFRKFRFTGGEPLVRKGVWNFLSEVNCLKSVYNFETGITTNGSLLAGNAEKLKTSGIDRLNISLDTLQPEKFLRITRRSDFDNVMRGIEESLKLGYDPLKINSVVIKGINDDEITDFVEFVKDKPANIRFIEFMPFGNNEWERNGFLNFREIKEIVERKYKLIPIDVEANAVAKDFQIAGHTGQVSFISSMSEHFCGSCNRVRVTSDGKFRLCLFSEGGHELNFLKLFRGGYSDSEILELLENAIKQKWEKHPEPEELAELQGNNMLKIGG